MEIRFLYFESENWGETPRQRVPLVNGVVAIVGENGSGKSTFVDGLKTLLGNAALEDNRGPDDYIPDGAGHAYVLGGADNHRRSDGTRPWDAFGYRSDVISLCCFISPGNTGRWEKSYYIVDGPFDPQVERTQYPSFTIAEYQQVMETMGCTRTFYRLMSLDPDKVKAIIKQKPRELFKDILNITGDKTLAENLVKHRQELKLTEDRLSEVSRKLYDKKREVDSLLKQQEEVRAYEEHLAEATRFDEVGRKAAWHFQSSKCDRLRAERAEEQNLVFAAQSDVDIKDFEAKQAFQRLEAARGELECTETELEDSRNQLLQAEKMVSEQKGQLQAHHRTIESAGEIHETKEELARTAQAREIEAAVLRQRAQDITKERTEAEQELTQARGGRDYPRDVSEFLDRCHRRGIRPRVVADALEFKDPLWQRAVESILGPDRFCLIVDASEIDTMFDLVDEAKYRSWVDVGYQGRIPDAPPGAALSQVEITDPAVYKFVRALERYQLAATKEEARRIRERGGSAITPTATVWTDRGIRNIDCGTLYCGKETRRKRIQELSDRVDRLENEKRNVVDTADKVSKTATKYRSRAAVLESAEQARDEIGRVENELRRFETAASGLKQQVSDLSARLTSAKSDAEKARQAHEEAKAALATARSTLQGHHSRWVDLGKSLDEVQRSLTEAEQRLAEVVPDREAWPFAGDDVATFLRLFDDCPADPEQLAIWLKMRHDFHFQRVTDFDTNRRQHIDFLLLRGLEGKQRQLKDLESQYQGVEYEVNMLRAQVEVTKNQHRVSVRRTIQRYLTEFANMAKLIPGTSTEGSKLIEVGEDDWELHLKVGFDGKEPVDYSSRKLSGGQKAATSVMLLMAALKLDGSFSLMFLDEPAARLDDKRARELGQLLRAAGAQILLTAPTSASMLAMDWIDHVLVTTKKAPGERHAPPIKVRYMRAVRGEARGQDAV